MYYINVKKIYNQNPKLYDQSYSLRQNFVDHKNNLMGFDTIEINLVF